MPRQMYVARMYHQECTETSIVSRFPLGLILTLEGPYTVAEGRRRLLIA